MLPRNRKFYAMIEAPGFGRTLETISYDHSRRCFAVERRSPNSGAVEMFPVTVIEYLWG
jgi:hypothetical protein